jgi:type I restriction enzyme S subunit
MGTLGRVFCNLYDRRYFADGHITVLRLKDDSKASWITAVLQSPIGARQLEQRQRGSSGQIEIYPEDILNVLIPMLSPRMAEIVGRKWSEAVELVEKSKTLYPEAEMELLERMGWEACKNERELYYTREFNELVQSERIDAEYHQPKYERLLQLLNKRGSMSLADLLKSCDKGMQPEGYDDDGEVIVVKSKNVFGQGIELTTCERTTSRAWESKYSRLGNGDAVINSTGMGTLGRAGVVHCDGNQKIVASVDLLILRVNHKLVDPDYLALFLNSPAGISQSEQYQTGSSGQLHIYPEHVNKFVVFIARHKNGEIDLSWQTNLGEKIRKAAQAKADARIKLEEAIKTVMERSLG